MTPTDRHHERKRGGWPWWMRVVGSRRREGYELTDAQVNEIKKSEKRVYGGARLVLGLTCGLSFTYAARVFGASAPSIAPAARLAILIAVMVAIGLSLNWWITNSSRMARVRYRKLREFGYPICARCGYDLRGGDPNSGPCPECGRDLSTMPAAITRPSDHSSSSPPASS